MSKKLLESKSVRDFRKRMVEREKKPVVIEYHKHARGCISCMSGPGYPCKIRDEFKRLEQYAEVMVYVD